MDFNIILERFGFDSSNFVNKSINIIKFDEGIIYGLAKNQIGRRFSNSIAENNNSHIQKVIDAAYGYKNFKRFRARVMLILTYKNKR